jgi:signal transduction histidine kinase
MNSTLDDSRNDDLIFFGKVNASISHELKNILAIISEAAGLLQDLTDMAARGKKIEFEMLQTCSQDIVEEIQRGFATIKQMNKFSHSVDDPVNEVNLVELVELMTALAGFLSTAAEVRLEPVPDAAPTVLTRPFRLQHLVYRALVFAFESAGPEGAVRVAVRPQPDGGASIAFSDFGADSSREFASESVAQLAASIGVEVREDNDSRRFELLVPETFEAGRAR